MAKVADVKLHWTKSPSADIDRVEMALTKDGTETKTTLGAEVEDVVTEVKANGAVQFRIDTFDKEGLHSSSEVYAFNLGDLEAPFPATGLGHQVVGIRDVPDQPTP